MEKLSHTVDKNIQNQMSNFGSTSKNCFKTDFLTLTPFQANVFAVEFIHGKSFKNYFLGKFYADYLNTSTKTKEIL